MDSPTSSDWESVLNPSVLRPRLMAASIYIAGIELLKDSIIDRVREFFSDALDVLGESVDPRYQTHVLSRNKSRLYASLDWLKSMNAIDEGDVSTFNRVKACRNTLAHGLLLTLCTQGTPADFEKCFTDMLELLRKIEVWWIREFEIPTSARFDGRIVADLDIQPGRCVGMQILCDMALRDQEESLAMFEEIRAKVKAGVSQNK